MTATAGNVVLVLAVGASRLLLGVHFVSDVVGGHLLGAAWLIASIAAIETWRVDEGWPRTDPFGRGPGARVRRRAVPHPAEPAAQRSVTVGSGLKAR